MAQADSAKNVSRPTLKRFDYVRMGFDASKLIASALSKEYSTIELQLDGTYTKKMNVVAEGGWANAKTNTASVSFKTSSAFLRFGFDNYFFNPEFLGDKDNAFIGLRLGGARQNKTEATAHIIDPFYGSRDSLITKNAGTVFWIELTAGFRMEVMKNIFLGWNIRGKTFINPKKIEELTPSYLAGYGNASKQPAFDYNLYVLYGFGRR